MSTEDVTNIYLTVFTPQLTEAVFGQTRNPHPNPAPASRATGIVRPLGGQPAVKTFTRAKRPGLLTGKYGFGRRAGRLRAAAAPKCVANAVRGVRAKPEQESEARDPRHGVHAGFGIEAGGDSSYSCSIRGSSRRELPADGTNGPALKERLEECGSGRRRAVAAGGSILPGPWRSADLNDRGSGPPALPRDPARGRVSPAHKNPMEARSSVNPVSDAGQRPNAWRQVMTAARIIPTSRTSSI